MIFVTLLNIICLKVQYHLRFAGFQHLQAVDNYSNQNLEKKKSIYKDIFIYSKKPKY